MTIEESSRLAEAFANAAHDHYRYTLTGEYDRVNAAAGRIKHVIATLHEIGDSTNQALAPLLKDTRPEVASMAAAYRLKHDQQASLEVLQRLSARNDLIGFEADQAVQRWTEGDWNLG